MTKPTRTSLQIRKADVDMYNKVRQLSFSSFVSDMLRRFGQPWIDGELESLEYLKSKK